MQTSRDFSCDPPNAARPRTGPLDRLRWSHRAFIVLSTALIFLAWHVSSTMLEARTDERFDALALQAVELFTERLDSHADLLRASAGLVAASENVTPDEWRRYTDALSLADQFPAISGLGVLYRVSRQAAPAFVAEQRSVRPDFRIFPDHAEALHLPLTLIAPRDLEANMVGFDLAHESLRREAIFRAMRRETVQITAPIDLAGQEGDLGFVMVAPFDSDVSGGDRPAGVTVASMRIVDLAEGSLGQERRQVAIRVSDGGRTLYDEHAASVTEDDREPRRSSSHTLPLYGREWHFEVQSTSAFHASIDRAGPRAILIGGLLLDVFLIALFSAHRRASRHSLSADRANASLRENQAKLEDCNEELEAFAHVVSHDLKTPLNGVMYLIEYIEEDLADYAHDAEARERVANNVRRLKKQVCRGRSLIEGVLTYSEAETRVSSSERVDVRALLEDIGDALELDGDRLVLSDDLPELETHRTRLDQVLTNLVSNAAKYHPDRARLRVEVNADRVDDRTVRFRVGDNGPGIEERYHERIFELFGTLDHASEVDSTGVGLSIVKKTVERLGGTISLESTPGRGTTFVFDWPAYPTALDEMPMAA